MIQSVKSRTEPKRVCYLISHGFAARMVLHSDVIPLINQSGTEVVIFCPDADEDSFRQFTKPQKLTFERADFQLSKLSHGQIAEFRRYCREPIKGNAALWSRHLYNQNSPIRWIRWRARAMLFMHKISYRSKLMQHLFGRLDRRIHQSKSLRRQLQQMAPDLVVATYPVSSFESACLVEAKRLGIPTAGHLLSWDNITCKGRFVVTPEYFLTWGPIMNEELQENYQVEPDRMFACGVPHFDAHIKLLNRERRDAHVAQLGLNPSKPYLFFGMSAPIFAPREIDIVEWLADQISKNAFGDEMQLIVRPHPQNVSGFMADPSWLPRLESLRSARVALNLPQLGSGKLAWNMEQSDLEMLVNLISGCSICLNSGSTLSIDALMQGKPVIVTFFDASDELPWWQSARRIQEFPHYRTLLETGGVQPVLNFQELTHWIRQFVSQPDTDLNSRQRAIERECGETDGQAAKRVAESLASIIRLPVPGEDGHSAPMAISERV